MKKSFYVVLAILLLCGPAFAGTGADESTCPAHRAGSAGHNPFGDFHEVMAPAWHTAWPAKDYDALFAAAPKFEKCLIAIMEMKPELREERLTVFAGHRDELAKVVKAYSEAVAKGDKEAVYTMMPDVHQKFEEAASALLPIHYPLVESLALVSKLIVETQLPGNDTTGIVVSTDKIAAQAKYLDEESIPTELKPRKDSLTVQFTELQKLATQMKECCDKRDMENYRKHAESFDGKIRSLIIDFL
jgi:uncharacterized protein YqgV (UPF0045/DUF77 family)